MPETLIIRPSDASDLGAVDALLARAYPKLLAADYPPSVQVQAIPIISRAQPALVRSGTYYVAETEAEGIVGAGGWTRSRRAAGRGDVRHVVTDDRHTRRGIGRAILGRIIRDAETSGIGTLDCQATWTAVPFYSAMGFRKLGDIEVPLAPGIAFPAVQMVRD